MKKFVLILIALTLLFVGCGGKPASPGNQLGSNTNATPQGQFDSVISEICLERDTNTKIKLEVTGGGQTAQSFEIVAALGKTQFDLTYTANDTVSVNGVLEGVNVKEQITAALEEKLTPPQAPDQDDTNQTLPQSAELKQALTLLKDGNALFVLNDTTVRGVEIIDGADNTITYVVDLYESQVKAALPILSEQFKNIVDVTGLSLTIKVSGSKTQIMLELNAIFNGDSSISLIKCYIEHTKIIKVID
jgi:hypothetical protein